MAWYRYGRYTPPPYTPPHTYMVYIHTLFYFLSVVPYQYPIPHPAGTKGRNRLRSEATRSFHTLYIVDLYLTDPLKFQRLCVINPKGMVLVKHKGWSRKIYNFTETYLQAQIALFYRIIVADKYFIDCKVKTS